METRRSTPNTATRWRTFNAIGVLGFLLQITLLWILLEKAALRYPLAVAVATEAAVLHNFAWHCRLTWRDRVGSPGAAARALARFHAANGAISLIGNVGLGVLLKEVLGLSALAASVIAIGGCALVNFLACHTWVFREKTSDYRLRTSGHAP